MLKNDDMTVPEFLLGVPIFHLKFTTGSKPTYIAYIKGIQGYIHSALKCKKGAAKRYSMAC